MVNKFTRLKRKKSSNEHPVYQTEHKGISDVWVIAIAPIIAYSLLYVYESTFLSYFGIPHQYINFDLAEVFIFVSTLIIIGFLMFTLVDFVSLPFISQIKDNSAKKRFIFNIVLASLCLFLSLFMNYLDEKLSKGLFYAGILFLTFTFLFPLFMKRKGNYFEKLEQSLIRKNEDTTSSSLSSSLINKYVTPTSAGLFLIYIVILIFAVVLGTNQTRKISYSIIKNNPECAIVYVKSSNVICVQFNRTTKEFDKGYTIFTNDSLVGVPIIEESIGPLHLKPTPTKTPIPTLTTIPTEIPTATSTP